MTRRGLGRGLDVLIPAGDDKSQGYQEVPLVSVTPNPYQPRQSFSDPDLDELAVSISPLSLYNNSMAHTGLSLVSVGGALRKKLD